MGHFGSHSRSSYPADKQVPLMHGKKRKDVFGKFMEDISYNTVQRRVEKQMHKKKSRAFARDQIKRQLNESP